LAAPNSQQQSRSESSPSGTARARDVISPISAHAAAAAAAAEPAASGRERFQQLHKSSSTSPEFVLACLGGIRRRRSLSRI